MRLILASQSPRRRELMALLHVPFIALAANIDETMDMRKPVCDEVARVSRAKAEAVPRETDDIVVAADTIVVCAGKTLGKPGNRTEAAEMLRMLSGREHKVMTGLTVLRGENVRVCTEVTEIRFRALSQKEIEDYIRTGEPMDKAGAYGIQGGGALFAERIAGDFYNVMGLPVCQLYQLLQQMAPEIMEDRQ